jgi:Mg2+/Co2+ transporter CorC
MTEDIEISDEINELKSNLAKLEEIVSKANTTKENKLNLLKEAKENKFIPKDELKLLSKDIANFDKIAIDKALIKKAKAKLIKLELEMALSEYTSLQDEYTQTHSEIEKQVNK